MPWNIAYNWDVFFAAQSGLEQTFNGDVAELFFWTGTTYVDASNTQLVGSFRVCGNLAGDCPATAASLGPTGAGPLGVLPQIYLRGNATNWPINHGVTSTFVYAHFNDGSLSGPVTTATTDPF